MLDHEVFQSPFSWRYGSAPMRALWSETNKRRGWRRIWVALAEVQQEAGLVTAEQVADLRARADAIDLERALQIESEIHHDLMAEVRTYAEQCPVGGGIIHLGATSMDIEDNADALRLRESLNHVIAQVEALFPVLRALIDQHAETVCMAFTHLQPAEPTTVGYRIAVTAQDLLEDHAALVRLRASVRGKGLRGAVGTSASYGELLVGTGMTPAAMSARVMAKLDLTPFVIVTQTAPRRQEWDILNGLAGVAMTLYKLAFDLRLLQSPVFGEWAEPFGKSQVGSSAMPFKRNPINAENIDSLARYVATLPRVAWDNAAHNLLERTLDDSANRRLVLPEAFLAVDEILIKAARILKGLRIDAHSIARNLERYGVFAATERVLMAASRAGGDRQVLHEVIREHSLQAWDVIRTGGANPLIESLSAEARIGLPAGQIRALLDASAYIGDAPERAREIAEMLG